MKALNKSEIKIQGDGEEKLDFTYIEDLISGIVSVLKSKNSLNEIFNITFGESRSINTLLEILKSEFKDIKVSYEQRDNLMPLRGTLSISKAKKLINYSSKWKLEDAYPRYINWYKNIFKS